MSAAAAPDQHKQSPDADADSLALAAVRSADELEQLVILGTGTFGTVYLVRHCTTQQPLALKVLEKKKVVRLKQVTHILNERDIMASINHPFIARLYSSFKDRKYLYMLFEYIPGGELFTQLRLLGRLPVEAARFYAAELLLALAHLHKRSIIHRDLKPENLLLDADGHLKLTDFGFAKRVVDRTFTLCGTPEYLAPEIVRGKGHGKEVDYWSFGVLLFEMLAGYPPFVDDNPFRIYEMILNGKVKFPPDFDPLAASLVTELLQQDRMRRLGNLKGGAKDVKAHPFFRGVDWKQLRQRKLKPPIVPPIEHEFDPSNYDYITEGFEQLSITDDDGSETYDSLFPDF